MIVMMVETMVMMVMMLGMMMVVIMGMTVVMIVVMMVMIMVMMVVKMKIEKRMRRPIIVRGMRQALNIYYLILFTSYNNPAWSVLLSPFDRQTNYGPRQ